jgi:ATP-dependent DNA ligase
VREAILQAFDLLELNGQDFRPLSLGERKKGLARLLARATPGIMLNEHTAAAGELVFRQACAMGLEGIVSKRLAAPYRSGPSGDWLKAKNPDSPGNGETSGGTLVVARTHTGLRCEKRLCWKSKKQGVGPREKQQRSNRKGDD